MRAKRLWDECANTQLLSLVWTAQSIFYFPKVNATGTHTVRLKARPVRGEKRAAWWEALHQDRFVEGRMPKLCSPGRSHFLKLAVRCVGEGNLQRNGDGFHFVREPMIITGLSFNTNGLGQIQKLTPALQNIVQKSRSARSVLDSCRASGIDQ